MRRWIMPAIGIALIVLGLAASLVLLLAHAGLASRGNGDERGNQRYEQGTSEVDEMFIEEMIPHHDDAIAMAEIGVEQAEHPELRDLAESIAATQRDENEQMREWYREWFDADVPESEGHMGGMMGGDVDLDEFAEAEPFDKAFIEEMVPHHRMAIMMARHLRAQTRRPEMRDFADQIIETQSDEIERMTDWYDEWYGQ